MDALDETIDEQRLFKRRDKLPNINELKFKKLNPFYNADVDESINDLEEFKAPCDIDNEENQLVPNGLEKMNASNDPSTIILNNIPEQFDYSDEEDKNNGYSISVQMNKLQMSGKKNKSKSVERPLKKSNPNDPDGHIKYLFGKGFEFSEEYLVSQINPEKIIKALKKRYKFKKVTRVTLKHVLYEGARSNNILRVNNE